MPVRPGDHVVFPASAGVWIEVEEERLLVCRVGELLGVLEPLENCPGCGGRIADHGPAKGPALDQDGHCGGCVRLAADAADWEREIPQ